MKSRKKKVLLNEENLMASVLIGNNPEEVAISFDP
jgi:hypothetical protein